MRVELEELAALAVDREHVAVAVDACPPSTRALRERGRRRVPTHRHRP
jgi:hypothetical protein